MLGVLTVTGKKSWEQRCDGVAAATWSTQQGCVQRHTVEDQGPSHVRQEIAPHCAGDQAKVPLGQGSGHKTPLGQGTRTQHSRGNRQPHTADTPADVMTLFLLVPRAVPLHGVAVHSDQHQGLIDMRRTGTEEAPGRHLGQVTLSRVTLRSRRVQVPLIQ